MILHHKPHWTGDVNEISLEVGDVINLMNYQNPVSDPVWMNSWNMSHLLSTQLQLPHFYINNIKQTWYLDYQSQISICNRFCLPWMRKKLSIQRDMSMTHLHETMNLITMSKKFLKNTVKRETNELRVTGFLTFNVFLVHDPWPCFQFALSVRQLMEIFYQFELFLNKKLVNFKSKNIVKWLRNVF